MITLKILEFRFRWTMFINQIRLTLLGRRVDRTERKLHQMARQMGAMK